MGDLSKDFSMYEFDCHDGTKVPDQYKTNVLRLVNEVLQPLRDITGSPIHVHSGYRTVSYNRACGGVVRSQHLVAKAADISIDGMDADYVNALMYGFMMARHTYYKQGGGVGWYKGFTHVDIRDGDHLSFWGKP